MKITEDHKTVAKDEDESEGGVVFLNREVDPNACNLFEFRVRYSESLDVWLGIERESPKFEWWFNLQKGQKFQSALDRWDHYTDRVPSQDETVVMKVEGDQLSYSIGGENLGICYIDERLKFGSIRPIVYIGDSSGEVSVLPGKVILEEREAEIDINPELFIN